MGIPTLPKRSLLGPLGPNFLVAVNGGQGYGNKKREIIGGLTLKKMILFLFCLSLPYFLSPAPSDAWFDETHVAMAKVTGYPKWFNAVGPDMVRHISYIPGPWVFYKESGEFWEGLWNEESFPSIY